MASACDTGKKSLNSIENNDAKRRENSPYSGRNKDVASKLQERGILLGSVIDEGLADKALDDLYGPENESAKLVAKIEGLLDANEGIQLIVNDFILQHAPKGIKLGSPTGRLKIENLPVKSLKLIYAKAITMSKQINPRGEAYSNFGGILSAIRTPKGLSWKEPTGAFYNITKATKDYPSRVSSRINMFISDLNQLKGFAKKVKAGKDGTPTMTMQAIFSDIKNLISDGDGRANQDLFHKYMMGWVKYENGEFYIYKDYEPRREYQVKGSQEWVDIIKGETKIPKGAIVRLKGYESTKDVMFSFQSPVKLKDYEDKQAGINKGDWDLKMPKASVDKFLKLAKEARKIDDLVFTYMERNMKSSITKLVKELSKTFPKLMPNQTKSIFFNPSSKESKAILKTLSKKDLDAYNRLKDIFGMYANDEFVIANGGKVEKRKNHFPVMYNRDVYKLMVDMMAEDFEAAIDNAQSIKDDPNSSPSDRIKAKKMVNDFRAKMNYAKSILDNLDGYHLESTQNISIPFAKDNKYFKRISNAYDIRSTRTDDSVYYDYLRHVMSSIERNNLTAELVKSLRIAKSDAVKRSAVNIYRVLFADPKAEGVFGTSVEGLTNRFGKNISPEQAGQSLRKIGSYLSGVYLSGMGSAVTNKSAMLQNIIDYGKEYSDKAKDIMSDKDILEKVEVLIRRSGIAEFSDFFSKSMVNGVIDMQLEEDISNAVLGEMVMYHYNIKKGKSEESAREEFQTNVSKYLKSSSVFLKEGVGKIIIPDSDRLAKRKKDLSKRMRQTTINKLLDYAINKEYQFKLTLKELPMSKIAKARKAVVDKALWGAEWWASQMRAHRLTMSQTEKYLRTLSFVIGVQKAHDSGILRNDVNWWDYTDEADISKAIAIGREYNEFTNFGLSTQEAGRFNYGDHGKLLGKFKVWAQQKFGRDVRLFHEAYLSHKSIASIESGIFDSKAVLKTMQGVLGKGKGKQLRIANPETQALRTFIATQGALTLLWDIFIKGPFRIPFLTRHAYKGILGKTTRNFSSDLISLLFMPLTMAIKITLANGLDEEEIERDWTYYMRRTFLGYVPMMALDTILTLWYLGAGEEEKAFDKLPIPAPPSAVNTVKEIIHYTN